MLTIALTIAIASLTVSFGLAFLRLLIGPSGADRVLALDTLYAIAVGLVLVAGLAWGTGLYVEVALLIALLGFVGTVAAARYLTHGRAVDD